MVGLYQGEYVLGAPKKYPLKNFDIFSRITERYDKKFYTLITHSIIRKHGKFRYIIYRSDKITLLLVMAT